MSQLTIGTSGGNKKMNSMFVGTSGGNKRVQTGWVGTSSGNKKFFIYFQVAVAPNPCNETYSGPGVSVFVQTPLCISTISGGSGSFTYQWDAVSGGTGINIDSPVAADTSFSATLAVGVTRSGVYHLTVTDTVTGQQVVSADVSVTINRP